MDLFLDSVDIFSESPLASPLGDGGLEGVGGWFPGVSHFLSYVTGSAQ